MRTPVERADVERFRALIAQRLGLQFEDGKLDFLAEVLHGRIGASGRGPCAAYLSGLAAPLNGAEELGALAEQLTVPETYFFRNSDHFRAFAEVILPDWVKANGAEQRLRVLSAGCASGEEAYSLAMAARDRLPSETLKALQILGVDINGTMLEKARRARYSTWALRETPPEIRARWFRTQGQDFVLDEAIRGLVTFEKRNLAEDDPLFWRAGTFEAVFCRNVTMYFSPSAMRALVARISHVLAPGGYLFLGHAETLRGISQDFHLRNTHGTFYYQLKGKGEISQAAGATSAEWSGEGRREALPALWAPDDSWVEAIHRASERIAALARAPGRSPRPAAPAGSADAQAASPEELLARPWNLGLAMELLHQERFADALENLHALPPDSRTDADAQMLRSVLLTNAGRVPEAEKVCRQLLERDELNAGAHYLMALCREHAGDRSSARGQDQTAIYLDPAFAMPHLHLGLVSKRSGDVATARRELEQALALLEREDASRILLFGGGFSREALLELCRRELRAAGGA